MRASARIVAEADGRGGTRLAVLRGESPLLLRRTGPVTVHLVTVHLVGGAAGPLRGDELRLDIEVGPGARLDVCGVAASLALPGRPGPPSRLEITAAVGPGARLRWRPEPLIAAFGCDHRALTRVEVAEGGALLWRDDLVCGRHGEDSGDVRADTTIRYAGRTLYRHELAVGPAAPGWSGAAVLGGGRAVGSAVLAGPGLPAPALLRGDAAIMSLAGPGLLATAVGTDIRPVRQALDPICDRFPPAPTAHPTATTPATHPTAATPAARPTALTPAAQPTALTPAAQPTAATPAAQPTAATPAARPTAATPAARPTALTPAAQPTATAPPAATPPAVAAPAAPRRSLQWQPPQRPARRGTSL
jgi:urease accessory protein